MARRQKGQEPTSQESFAWSDASRVLEGAPDGEVIYEAPELRKRRRSPRIPKGQTLGLPFGAREADGRSVCWSCGAELHEDKLLRAGPGDVRCPGCGAKLPFF